MKKLSEMTSTERLYSASSAELVAQIQSFTGIRLRDTISKEDLVAIVNEEVDIDPAAELPLSRVQPLLREGLSSFLGRTRAQHACSSCEHCPTARMIHCWESNLTYAQRSLHGQG